MICIYCGKIIRKPDYEYGVVCNACIKHQEDSDVANDNTRTPGEIIEQEMERQQDQYTPEERAALNDKESLYWQVDQEERHGI